MLKPISDNEVLNSFNNILSYLPSFFDDDVSIAITTKNSFLISKGSKNFYVKSDFGDPIPEGGAIFEAIKTGQTIIKSVPQHVYGTPFKSYAVPIKSEYGEVVGCIVLAKSLLRKEKTLNLSKNLLTSIEQISIAINELSVNIQNVVNMNSEIELEVKQVNGSTKNTDEIVDFIKEISAKTNILGLNATIEASRAGEFGRGFNVVAKEVRKLSVSTSESINKINFVINDIESSINNINGKISGSNNVFQEQAASLEEISASIEEIRSSAQMLKSLF